MTQVDERTAADCASYDDREENVRQRETGESSKAKREYEG